MIRKFSATIIFYIVYLLGYHQTSTQGFCMKYTCEKNPHFVSNLMLTCTSDTPEMTGNGSNNYGCSADLQLLDLKLGVTICSRTAPSYSVNLRPDQAASQDLETLYRYLQGIASQTATTSSMCYYRRIQPTRPPPTMPYSPATTPFTSSGKRVQANAVSREALIAAAAGGFFGGVIVACLILALIYFCCIRRRNKEKSRRFTINPRINEAYQRDPNDNLDSIPTDLTQKDWRQEHRGRIDRLNGVINAFTLENVVDQYATIEETTRPERPAPPRPAPEDISTMYSTVDKTKKRQPPNGYSSSESPRPGAFQPTSPNEIYIKGRKKPAPTKPGDESVASSSEIVPPENALHLYNIIEKPES